MKNLQLFSWFVRCNSCDEYLFGLLLSSTRSRNRVGDAQPQRVTGHTMALLVVHILCNFPLKFVCWVLSDERWILETTRINRRGGSFCVLELMLQLNDHFSSSLSRPLQTIIDIVRDRDRAVCGWLFATKTIVLEEGSAESPQKMNNANEFLIIA